MSRGDRYRTRPTEDESTTTDDLPPETDPDEPSTDDRGETSRTRLSVLDSPARTLRRAKSTLSR